MAQTTKPIEPVYLHWQEASNLAVAVAASGNTTLLELPVRGLERVFVQFTVTDNALDGFIIQGRCSRDAALVTLYDTAGDFTVPTGLLLGTSGDLTSVAAAGNGWFIMDVRGLQDIKVLASGNGAATVSIHAGGQ